MRLRALFILILSFLIVSCNFDGSSKDEFGKKPDDGPTVDPIEPDPNEPLPDQPDEPTGPVPPKEPEPIVMSASRDYRPSSWENYQGMASIGASYVIPGQVDVVAGNSGTGWLSLTIGQKKICFQGNARNNNSGDGNLFLLKKEKEDPNSPCNSRAGDKEAELHVEVESGDEFSLIVDGGGCGRTCAYTEVELVLVPEEF